MGWSRSARIKTLLAIDTVFLFIELITGYAVGSLALVADSFHMLNDVMSLIVALYALKLAENSTRSNKYSYGWQRAEILGALINGVFLLALCFSIFLEALQRMFEAPEVRSPKLVVIVGSLGLLSNIVGLFLFHEHGHSHGGGGGGGHSHGHSHAHDKKAEEGHSHSVKSKSSKKGQNGLITIGTSARNGAGANATPDERSPLLAGGSSSREADFPALPTAAASSHGNVNATASRSVAIGGAETPFTDGDDDEYDDDDDGEMRNELDGIEELLVHPARTREAIVRQAYDAGFGSPRNSNDAGFGGHRRSISLQSAGAAMSGKRGRTRAESMSKKTGNRERSASRSSAHGANHGEHGHTGSHEHSSHDHEAGHAHGDGHDHHDHAHDHGDSDVDEEDEHDEGHSHGGHSHDNMNMRGVFLHVMGDALGNVGVIAAGLIIWLTKSPYRFYSDPVISFIITIIIFSSALPLVRSASFILLQGTPSHVPLEKVRSAILKIPNVISVHDLHIWSLSESKLVASMHILVKSHNEFAPCSREVRKVLHRFGVHSTTIQPELLDVESATGQAAVGMIMSRQGSSEMLANGAGAEDDGVGCMAQCDDSCVDNSCCPPVTNQAIAAALSSKSNQSLRAGSNGNTTASGSKMNGNLSSASYASVASSHNH